MNRDGRLFKETSRNLNKLKGGRMTHVQERVFFRIVQIYAYYNLPHTLYFVLNLGCYCIYQFPRLYTSLCVHCSSILVYFHQQTQIITVNFSGDGLLHCRSL